MIRLGFVDDDPEHLGLLESYMERYGREENLTFEIQEYQNGLNFVVEALSMTWR